MYFDITFMSLSHVVPKLWIQYTFCRAPSIKMMDTTILRIYESQSITKVIQFN